MKGWLRDNKYNQIKGLVCLIIFVGLLIILYAIDNNSMDAKSSSEEITSWNSDNDTYSTMVLDGKNNGYILSKEGKVCYYQYERKNINDNESKKDESKKDELLESGTYEFDKDYGWTFRKKTYKNGLVAEESVEDNSNIKKKVPFQQILQKGMQDSKRLDVVFSSGTYEMYGPFRIYSYTDIENETGGKPVLVKKNNEAMFVNVDDSDSNKATVTEYKGAYGINIRGLDVDLDGRYSSVFKATHASNYIVEQCHFYNGQIGHILEFNAMKNVCVRDCKFENIDYDTSGLRITRDYADSHMDEDRNYFVEVIQIEGDSSEKYRGNTPMGKYSWPITRISNDNTSSKNILIQNNEFKGVISGIGHHYYNDENYAYQTNAKIFDNKFEDVVYNAICLYGYKNIEINDNYFKNVSTDKIGGLNVFLKGCVNDKNEPVNNDFIDEIAKNNKYYSKKDDSDKKLSDSGDESKKIIISQK